MCPLLPGGGRILGLHSSSTDIGEWDPLVTVGHRWGGSSDCPLGLHWYLPGWEGEGSLVTF